MLEATTVAKNKLKSSLYFTVNIILSPKKSTASTSNPKKATKPKTALLTSWDSFKAIGISTLVSTANRKSII